MTEHPCGVCGWASTSVVLSRCIGRSSRTRNLLNNRIRIFSHQNQIFEDSFERVAELAMYFLLQIP